MFRNLAFVALLAVCQGCGFGSDTGYYVETRGDSTFVYSGGPGTIGAMRLVEELSIGEADGDEEYTFGYVFRMAVDPDGGVYTFDRSGPALRYFDATGQYVRTLGGPGEGPGEYQADVLGMHVRSDGRLILRDARNRRLTLFNADGSFSESWHLESGLFTSGEAIVVDAQDVSYLRILTGRPQEGEPWPFGDLRLAADGTPIDTLLAPTIPGEPADAQGRFDARKIWARMPNGGVVVGISDPYSFEIRHPDGKVVQVRRDYAQVQVEAEERLELEALNEWRRARAGSGQPDIPPVGGRKPAYKGFLVADDGNIWVQRFTHAEKDTSVEPREVDRNTPPAMTWREPSEYDVFSPEGTHIGSIRLPTGVSLDTIRGSQAWGIRTGDLGEQYIVRYRIESEATS